MTELRKRMIESLQLRGLSERTQECYVRAVRQLAEHFHKSPDLISEEELRQYFLYLKNVKKWSRPSTTIALCGIKFFFDFTLNKPFTILSLVRPAPEKKLPVILSQEEVRKILSAIRLPRYRVCLTTIYSCGLRLQEGTHLQVADIDKRSLDAPHPPRQRQQRPLRAAAAKHSRTPASVLAYPSPPALALSCRGARPHQVVSGQRAAVEELCATRFPRGSQTKSHP